MSASNDTVPLIAITTESNSDNETQSLNADTDVEEVSSENENKLFSKKGAEKNVEIHAKTINENNTKTVSSDNSNLLGLQDVDIGGNVTEFEEMDGSENDLDDEIITDENTVPDILNIDNSVEIHDNVSILENKKSGYNSSTKKFSGKKYARKHTRKSNNTQKSSIVEVLHSESDSETEKDQSVCSKKRRPKFLYGKPKVIFAANSSSSDEGKITNLIRQVSLSKTPGFVFTQDDLNSLKTESVYSDENSLKKEDNKDEDICIFPPTDTEDYETDGNVSDNTYYENMQRTPEPLRNLQDSYSSIIEESAVKNAPPIYVTETFPVHKEDNKLSDSETSEEDDIGSGDDVSDSVEQFTTNNDITFAAPTKILSSNKQISTKSNNLSVGQPDTEALTDVENLASSDESSENENPIPNAVIRDHKDSSTDSEDIDIEIIDVNNGNFFTDMELPEPVRRLVTIKSDESGVPTTHVEPLPEDINFGKLDISTNDVATDSDEVSFAEDETVLSFPTDFSFSNFTLSENSYIQTSDYIDERKKNTNLNEDCLTDSELVILNKSEKISVKSSKLRAPVNDDDGLTDKEELLLSDTDLNTFNNELVKKSKLSVNAPEFVPDNKTDVEDIVTDDDIDPNELITLHRALSTTPDMMKRCENETIVFKETDNILSSENRMSFINDESPIINKRTPKSETHNTDTEDIFTSADEELAVSYSRAETATPLEMKKQLEESDRSHVFMQCSGKFDETDEVLHIKGGGYLPDKSTDIEEIGISDEDTPFQNITSEKEWSPSGEVITEKPQEDEKSILKDAIEIPDEMTEDPAMCTYSFMTLCTPSGELETLPPKPSAVANISSYSEIDRLLEEMLTETEIEELILENEKSDFTPFYVNKMELVPSVNAIIEIPIKKNVPKKIISSKEQKKVDSDLYKKIDNDTNLLQRKECSEKKLEDCFTDDQTFHDDSKNDCYSCDPNIWWEGTFRVNSPNKGKSAIPLHEIEKKNNILSKSLPNIYSDQIKFDSFFDLNVNEEKLLPDNNDNNDNMTLTEERPIKAEIKLFVKTKENGRETMEMRSVREFLAPETLPYNKTSKHVSKKIHNTLSSLSKKLSDVTNKFSKTNKSFISSINKSAYRQPSRLNKSCKKSSSCNNISQLSKNTKDLIDFKKISRSGHELVVSSCYPQYPLSLHEKYYTNVGNTQESNNCFTNYDWCPTDTKEPLLGAGYCDWVLPSSTFQMEGLMKTAQEEKQSNISTEISKQPAETCITAFSIVQDILSKDLTAVKKQTLDFLSMESQSEPYAPVVEKMTFKEKSIEKIEPSKEKEIKKEKTKGGKGFFGTLKSLAKKSFDHSDSDSKDDQSPKKAKKNKTKKHKKSKPNDPNQSSETEVMTNETDKNKIEKPDIISNDNGEKMGIKDKDIDESDQPNVLEIDENKLQTTSEIDSSSNKPLTHVLHVDDISQTFDSIIINPQDFSVITEKSLIKEDLPCKNISVDLSTVIDVDSKNDISFIKKDGKEDTKENKDNEEIIPEKITIDTITTETMLISPNDDDVLNTEIPVTAEKIDIDIETDDSNKDPSLKPQPDKNKSESTKSGGFFSLFGKKGKKTDDQNIKKEILPDEDNKDIKSEIKIREELIDSDKIINIDIKAKKDFTNDNLKQQNKHIKHGEKEDKGGKGIFGIFSKKQKKSEDDNAEMLEAIDSNVIEITEISEDNQTDTSNILKKVLIDITENEMKKAEVTDTISKIDNDRSTEEPESAQEEQEKKISEISSPDKNTEIAEINPKLETKEKIGFFDKLFGTSKENKYIDKNIKDDITKTERPTIVDTDKTSKDTNEQFEKGTDEQSKFLDSNVIDILNTVSEKIEATESNVEFNPLAKNEDIQSTSKQIIKEIETNLEENSQVIDQINSIAKTEDSKISDYIKSNTDNENKQIEDVIKSPQTIEDHIDHKKTLIADETKKESKGAADSVTGFFKKIFGKTDDSHKNHEKQTESQGGLTKIPPEEIRKDIISDSDKQDETSNKTKTEEKKLHETSTDLNSKVEELFIDMNSAFDKKVLTTKDINLDDKKDTEVKIKETAKEVTEKSGEVKTKVAGFFDDVGSAFDKKVETTKDVASDIKKDTEDNVKEGATAVSEKSSDVKTKVGGFFDDVSSAFDKKIETTKDVASDIKKDTKDKVKEGATAVSEKSSDVKTKVGGFFDDVGSAFDKKIETTKDVASDIKKDTKDNVKEGATAISAKSSDIKTKAGGFFDDVSTAFDKNIETTKDVASDIKKDTKDKVKEGATAVSEKSSDVKTKVGGFFDDVGSAFDKKVETTKDVASDIKKDTEDKVKEGAIAVTEKSSDVKTKVGGFIDDVSSAFDKKIETTKDDASDIKKNTEDKVKEGAKAVSEKSSDVKTKVGGFFDDVGSAFDKKVETTKDVASDIKKDTEDKVKDGATAVSEKSSDVKTKVGGFFDDVSSAFDKKIETSKDVASDIKKDTKDKVKEGATAVSEKSSDVKTKVGGFFDDVGSAFDKKVETTKDVASDIKKDTEDKVKDGATAVSEKSSDVKTKVGGFFDDESSAFDKKIETSKDVASDIKKDTKDKVKEGATAVSEKSSDVKTKVGGFFDDVGSAFDKKVETTKDVASDIKKNTENKVKKGAKAVSEKSSDVKTKVGGLFDDINSAFDKKIETTKDVASDIKKDTKENLKEGATAVSEKSSDVKTKVGGFFDDVGSTFDKKVETTKDVASDIKKDTKDKVKEGATAVSEKSSDVKTKVGGFFDDVGSAFDKKVETTKDVASDIKKDTEDKVKEGAIAVSEKSSDVKTKVGGFFEDVGSAFDKKVETTKDVASDIKKDTEDKVKEGAIAVTEKSSDVKTKVGGFFDDVSSAFDKKIETTKDVASDIKKDTNDKVKEGATAVSEKSSDVKTKVGGFFDDVGSAFDKKVETTKDVASDIKKDTEDNVKESATAVSEKSSNVKTKVSGFFDDISSAFDKKIETSKDVASDIKKDTKDKVKESATAVSEKSSDVKMKVGGFFDDVSSAFDKKVETSKDVSSDIKKDTEDKVKKGATAVSEKSSDVKTKVGGLFDDISSAFSKKIETTKEVAADIKNDTEDKVKEGATAVSEKSSEIKTKVGGYFDDVGSAFDKKVETTKDVASDIKKDAKDKVKDGAKTLSEKSSDVKTTAGGFFDDVSSAFDKKIETTKDVASDIKKDTKDKVKDGVTAVSEKSSDVKTIVGGFIDDISSAFDKKIETSKDVASDIKKDTKDKVKEGATAVSEKSSDVKTKVGGFFDDVGSAFDKKVETTKDVASDIKTDTKDKVKDGANAVSEKSSDVKTKVGGFFDDISSAFDMKIETSKDVASDIKKDTKDKLKEGATTVSEKSSDVKTKVGGFFDDVGSAFDKKVETTKDVAADIKKESEDKVKEGTTAVSEKSIDVKTKVGGFFDDVSSAFDKKVETTKDVAADIKKDTEDKIKEGATAVSEKSIDVKTKVGGFFDDVGSAFDKKVETTKDVASDIKKDTKDKIKDGAKTLSEKSSDVKTTAGEFFDDVGSAFDKKVETTKDVASDIKKDTEDKVKESAKAVSEKSSDVKTKVGGFFDDVSSAFDKKIETTKDVASDIKKDTKDKVKDGATAVSEKSSDVKTKVGGFFDDVSSAFDKKIETTKDVASDIKKDTKDNVKEGATAISAKSSDIKTKAGGFFDDVSTAFDKKVETTKDVASDIKKDNEDKLKEGAIAVSEKSGDVKTKVGGFFDDVSSAFDKKVETTKDVALDIKKDTEDKVKVGATTVSEKSSDIKTKVGGFFDYLSSAFDKKTETTKDVASDIKKDTEDKVKESATAVSEKSSEVKTKVGGFFDNVGSGFDKKVETTKDDTSDIKKDIEDKVKEGATAVSEKCSDVKTKVGGFFDDVSSALDKKVETTKDVAADIKKVTKDNVKDGAKVVSEKSNDVKSKVGGFFDDVSSAFDKKVETTKDITLDIKNDTEDKVKEGEKEVSEKSSDIKTKVGGFFDDVSSAFDKEVETNIDIASDFKKDTEDKVVVTAKAVTEKSDDVKTKVGEFFDDISSAFDKKIETTKDVASDIKKDTKDKVKEGATAVSEKSSDVKTKVGGFFDDVGSAFDKKVETTKDVTLDIKKDTEDKVKKGAKAVSEKSSDVKTKEGGFFDDVSSAFAKEVEINKDIASDFKKDTEDKVVVTAKAVTEKSGDVKTKVGEFFDGVSSAFDKKVEVTKDVASDIKKDTKDKVKDGAKVVSEKSSDVKSKVGGFFDDVGSAFDKKVETTKDVASDIKKDTKYNVKDGAKTLSEKSCDVKTTAGGFFDNVSSDIDRKVETTKDVASKIKIDTEDIVKDSAKAVIDKSVFIKSKDGGIFEDFGSSFDKNVERTKDVVSSVGNKDIKNNIIENVINEENMISSFDIHFPTTVQITDLDVDVQPVEEIHDSVEETLKSWHPESNITQICKSSVLDSDANTDMTSNIRTLSTESASLSNLQLDDNGKANSGPTDEFSTNISERNIDLSTLKTIDQCQKDLYSAQPLSFVTDAKKKRLFHIESEDGDFSQNYITDIDESNIELETPSILEAYNDNKTDDDLTKLEEKLSNIDMVLKSMEDDNIQFDNSNLDDTKHSKKLRRIERHFERMASETLEQDKIKATEEKIPTPELERSREIEFQRIVSQLSTEEVSDFQKEYSNIWDDGTFTASEDWESKTPDSTAEVQDLPQETTGEPLTTIATTTTQNITELTPKPKPRITKQLDSQIELTSPIESFELTDDIPLSPVQNESANIEKVQVGISPSESITENYSYRKKFWEGMSSSNQTGKKRMSLATETVTTHDSSQFKKRTSVHEVEVILPIPKPRSTVQQQIANDEEVLDNEDKKPLLSEYMASFQCPLQDEKEPKKRYVESPQTEIDVPETLDSNEQYDIHRGYDNDGFRSDSIESEEFDDRLSHLKGDTDQPPIAAVRTILLERSASLPTSDLSTTRKLLEKAHSGIKSDLLESSDLIDNFYLHKRSDIDSDLKLNYKKRLIDDPSTDGQPLHVSAATETYISSKVEENVENIALDNSQTIRLSLEMHVDKSELEDSEKFVEIEQSSSHAEKRFERELDSISKVGQILDLEKEQKDFIHELRALSPINMPEEHVPDTVWEVPIQSQPITVEEAVTYIPTTQVVSTDTKFKTDKKQDLIPLNLQSSIDEEEAKIKAKELISNIEDEIQKRYDCFATEIEETSESTPDPELAQNQVSEYLHQLASAKGLDESEVELVKSILARKQLSSIERTDTQTSSTEITDEDLKCTDLEINNLLSEIKKPETKSTKPDLLAIEKTLAEVQESLHAAQEELLETGMHKKPSPSEFQFKSLAHEKKIIDKIEETQYEDISTECTTMHGSIKTETHSYIEEEFKNKHHESFMKTTKETSDLKSEVEERVHSIDEESMEILSSHKIEALGTILIEEKTNEIELAAEMTKQISISNISKEINLELTERIASEKLTKDKDSTSESKSCEEQTSSTSSCRKTDTDSLRTSDASDVLLRKGGTTKDTDTSSSSGAGVLRATDRRSTADNEAWSSSGESYYQSFEQDSLRSRPCSSDVEGLVAAGGSSEYESALTTQDKSYLNTTSAEYHTAVSSISSRESMKSLDSESSGNLASVEVSEASETLVPSAFELDGDFPDETQNDEIQDEIADFDIEIKDPIIPHITDITSVDILGHSQSINQVNRSQPDESIDVSEEDSSAHEIKTFNVNEDEIAPKMKRSYEMTFQPEPRIIIADSPQSETGTEIDEKFVTSIADGSISYSSTSETSMQKTVVDITQTPGMNMLDSLEQLSMEDSLSDIKDNVTHDASIKCVSDVASSKTYDNDYQNIQTKILSNIEVQEKTITEQNGPTQVDYIPEYDNAVEQKKKGHRRQESSTSFTPTIISQIVPIAHTVIMESPQKDFADSKNIEFDKVEEMIKRTDSDGEPEVDASEIKPDSEYSRPQSQVSKSDSESHKAISVGLSDDRPDSELSELLKQCSSEAPDDPIERPPSPEPTDVYEKSESSGTQAGSGRESELEFSSPYPRSPDYQTAHTSIEYTKTESVTIESKIKSMKSEIITKVSDISDLAIKSLEKSSTEESEAEAAFQMVPHTSPVHQAKLIGTILEDVDAEKHEIEKKYVKETNIDSNLQDQSPYIPDITVTQHMAPLIDRGFHYPDLELEQKEDEAIKSTPQTPASISSKSSEDTDQGREYILNECDDSIPEEIESCLDEKIMTESRSEISTTTEEKTTIYETETKEPSSPTESPTSDSFEMLEKPDITDEFVVIEEVGREAAETDTEGKSVAIRKAPKYIRKHDGEVEEYLIKSAPAKLTDIKYYPEGGSSSDELGPFEFEDSPPTMDKRSSDKKTGKNNLKEYERDVEASKKWMEMQFQDQSTAAAMAAAAAAGYGYEMEFERLPLEDIKEEEMTDFDPSSRMGSLGSQKNSGGSYSSVKDSFSSTPDYDVLAGRKFFTRSSDHDDISMSSLQEFENLEQAISLENRKYQHGSQDSLSNGSFPKRYYASKSGQGDDVSCSSLKEFEGLETACIQAHKIEIKAKEEEALLAQIDEGHESTFSESESCETVSITSKKYVAESEEDDYEKRMFEIDEIIRQAQSNVEKFIDQKDLDRTQSLGRGDSLEEVAKVPDLELDAPADKNVSSQDNIMIMSTDSLDIKKSELNDNSDSLKNVIDLMNTSTDSIEFQNRTRETTKDIMTDSIEMHEPLQDRSIVASDSLELTASMDANLIVTSDSIDEDGSRIGEVIFHDKSSSSGREGDPSSSSKDINVKYADLMLGSTDSLEPSSSTATHATYQYETDSVFSGSFTSGGSNTMVSSTDTIDPNAVASGFQGADLSAALCQVWSDDNSSSGEGSNRFDTRYYTDDLSKPYVTEVIEPCESGSEFSHTIHRTVELPAEIQKVTFRGPDVEGQIEKYMEEFNEGEMVHETEEVDADGNVHVKRVIQKRIIIKPENKNMSESEMKSYVHHYMNERKEKENVPMSDYDHLMTSIARGETPASSDSDVVTHRTYVTRHITTQGDRWDQSTDSPIEGSSTTKVQPQGNRRRPLRYEISVDDQTEVDPREHDWRFGLPLHAETEEASTTVEGIEQREVPANLHGLSDEMKELLAEMEKQARK